MTSAAHSTSQPAAGEYSSNDAADGILWLNATAVASIFDRETALASQREAFLALGRRTAQSPQKIMIPDKSGESVSLTYSARLSEESGPVTKCTTVHPGNAVIGFPTISAIVIAVDPATGRTSAILDGTSITTRRTAAASALAVSLLAVDNPTVLTVLGTGVQAREHVRAIASVTGLAEVRIAGRNSAAAKRLAVDLSAELGLRTVSFSDARTAVEGAHIVAACTTSHAPVLKADWLSPGALVISVGSFEADRCEVGPDTVLRADLLVVDDAQTSAIHAGPIVAALMDGSIGFADLVGLGDVLVGSHPGRTSPTEVIYYNTTGLGVQDAAAAWAIVERARNLGIGTITNSLAE